MPATRWMKPRIIAPTSTALHTTGGSGASQTAAPDIPSLESLFSAMLAHYMPETVEFTSLSEDMVLKYKRMFAQPEVFLQTQSSLLILPYAMDEFSSRDDGDLER